MSVDFEKNPQLRYYFEKLPIDIKTKIVESAVNINSVDELFAIAQRIKEKNQ